MLPSPLNHPRPHITLNQISLASVAEAQFLECNEENPHTSTDNTLNSQISFVHRINNYSLPLPGSKKQIKLKYPRMCCVGGCGATANDQNISLHKFPKDKIVALQWIRKLKIKRQSNVLVACSKHFKSSDFFPLGKTHMFNT